MKNLIRRFIIKDGSRVSIDSIDCGEGNFTPKALWTFGRNQESTHRIKYVTMFAIGTTILRRCAGTRVLRKSALRLKEREERKLFVFP